MPNDDLGSFPMPPQTDSTMPEPTPAPLTTSTPDPIVTTESITPTTTASLDSTFEPTPDEIPSAPITSPSLTSESENLVSANEDLIAKYTPEEPPLDNMPEPIVATPEPPKTPSSSEPVLATIPPKKSSITPVIIIILLIVAGIGLASAAFLYQQSSKLKNQLSEITSTLEKQQTIITPTPSPSIFEMPTPMLNPESSDSAKPTLTPTQANTDAKLIPLSLTDTVLQIAIKHSPNAQLILIKTDNVENSSAAITKYFFREDTTTKKYFYIAITGNTEPQIVDKQIYVTPDNNIPSLNDDVLKNTIGLDLDEILKITYAQCANATLCTNSPVKAQYIKTTTAIIWQLSVYTKGVEAIPLMIQVNAQTKAIVYKSPEFALK